MTKKEAINNISILDTTLKALNSKYGANTITTFDTVASFEGNVIPSSSLGVNMILGVGGLPIGRIIEIFGPEECGKAQPLWSKVLTPNGWVEMGELEVGDIVCSPDGDTTTVIGIFPQGEQDIYKITFDDKTYTYCTLDHLWMVYTRNNPLSETLSTKQLLENGLVTKPNGRNKNGTRKYKIPISEPLKFNEQSNLPIDPYLLGLLLGDGSFRDCTIKYTTSDEELLSSISSILNEQFPDMCISNRMGKYSYHLKNKTRSNSRTDLFYLLEKMGLTGKLSQDKFIPKEYLYGSINDRLALLQGLMDTDGTVSTNGGTYCSFCTSSKQLSEDFLFLARSLGFRCTVYNKHAKYTAKSGEKVDGLLAYNISLIKTNDLVPFRLKRKLDKYANILSVYRYRYIESISPAGKAKCQCIKVGHTDQLYITDDFIVTHNTTAALDFAANCQKQGGKVVFVDIEHALSPTWAEKIGTDLHNNFYISQPDYGEDALDIVEALVRTGEVDLIIVDSVAALLPKAEAENEMGDQTIGLIARLMSRAMRKLVPVVSKSNCAVIFINQLRSKINTFGFGANPDTTTGGNALKYAASIRLEFKKVGQRKENDVKIGNNIRIQCIKNKVAAPYKICEIPLIVDEGFSTTTELIDALLLNGLAKKGGAWYTLFDASGNGEKVDTFQGQNAFKEYFLTHPDIKAKYLESITL